MGEQTSSWEEVKQRGIEIFFQPIYNVKKRRITGLEALFRVKDEQSGYLNTEELVQEAEKDGWVHNIDLWMLRQCCRYFTVFAEHGITRINVNLSPRTCMEDEIWEKICTCLDTYGLQHKKIWLEMTELGLINDKEKLIETAAKLRERDFCLVMDDFGKGDSNFIRLMDFEFSSIKLDKELVWGIESRPMGMPIVETMMEFARRNQIVVTAEGIESMEQAKMLAGMGCNFLQGYRISKPLTARECLAFVVRWKNADILEEDNEQEKKTQESLQNEEIIENEAETADL